MLLFDVCLAGTARADTRRVLLLSSSERPFAPQSTFADALVPELIRSSREPIEFIEMSLKAVRSSGLAPDVSIAQRLRSAFGAERLDLVITIGGPAATFAQQFRRQLFPTTPMLIAGVDRRFVEHGTFTEYETTVATQHEPALMIDQIVRLLPETRSVTVVIGASQVEQFWLQEMKREFSRFDGRLQFVWTNELSFAEIVERCRTQPAHSAIFFAVLSLDAKGEPQVGDEAFTSLRAVANAPMFGLYGAGLGRGIVGGPLLVSDELSRTTANVALRILAGESPRSIRTPTQRAGTPTFDWRELRRWNIPEHRLPPGSVVRFHEPTFWQRYRRQLIVGASIAALPTLAGILMLVSLAKRRPARREPFQMELSNLSRQLMRAHEQERAAVATKLHDDVCQRILALRLRLHALKGGPHDGEIQAVVDEVNEQLSSLVGEIFTVPDPVYQKLELLGLTTLCRTHCEELSAQHDVPVHFEHENVPGNLPTDVALCLFRVLQEATANAVNHSATRDVWVSLRGTPAQIRLEVLDSGVGFDTDRHVRSHGVGLVAIRERLKLVDGGSAIESRPGEGTRIVAWAPLRPQR